MKKSKVTWQAEVEVVKCETSGRDSRQRPREKWSLNSCSTGKKGWILTSFNRDQVYDNCIVLTSVYNSTRMREHSWRSHLVLCPLWECLCARSSCYGPHCSWWRSRPAWSQPTCPPRCRCPHLHRCHRLDPTQFLPRDSRSRWQLGRKTNKHTHTFAVTHYSYCHDTLYISGSQTKVC